MSDLQTAKPLSCPFCQHDPLSLHKRPGYEIEYCEPVDAWWHSCPNRECGIFGVKITKEKWNRRACPEKLREAWKRFLSDRTMAQRDKYMVEEADNKFHEAVGKIVEGA